MLRDLDGSFSCLAATESEFGFVKDPFAFKPLVFTETDRFVAVATEEIAFRAALPGDYDGQARRRQGSARMAEIDCGGRTTREINAEIKRRIAGRRVAKSWCATPAPATTWPSRSSRRCTCAWKAAPDITAPA